jgi:hypothetical protein
LSPTERRQPLQFVRYFVIINRPSGEVEAELLANGRTWLPSFADDARVYGARLISTLGIDNAPLPSRVEVKLGRPRRARGLTRIPIEISAEEGTRLYLALVGQLEIGAIGPSITQLGITTAYQPETRLIKAVGDRALLHRVAEASVRELMEQIRVRLASQESK